MSTVDLTIRQPGRWLLGVCYCLLSSGALAVPWRLSDAQLQASYWIDRTEQPERVLLSPDELQRRNQQLRTTGPNVRDLTALPASMPGSELAALIQRISADPPRERVLASGQPPSKRLRRNWQRQLNLRKLPSAVRLSWALVSTRADLRALPIDTPLFSTQGSTDLDRLQESALFPGEPVAIAHRSKDQQWAFVLSERYAAWMKLAHLAETDRQTALSFAASGPVRWILDADADSSYDPIRGEAIRLDMGTHLPWQDDWPVDQPVAGQLPLAHWVLTLPDRAADGRLQSRPILLPKSIASAPQPLPFTRANVLRQGFKFLGERYGWGHDLGGRDCSGLISEIFRSLGLLLPRNTGDQAKSQTLAQRALVATLSHDQRIAELKNLHAGDLLFMPGHVMMLVGQLDGEFYVLHDAHTARVRGGNGALKDLPFRGVVLTPLSPLLAEDGRPWIDLLTVLQGPELTP